MLVRLVEILDSTDALQFSRPSHSSSVGGLINWAKSHAFSNDMKVIKRNIKSPRHSFSSCWAQKEKIGYLDTAGVHDTRWIHEHFMRR